MGRQALQDSLAMTERAYRGSDALTRRCELMDGPWAAIRRRGRENALAFRRMQVCSGKTKLETCTWRFCCAISTARSIKGTRKPSLRCFRVVRHGFETPGCACSGGQG